MDKANKIYIFEKMPVLKAVLKLAIPSVIGQLILVIYNLADTFFIGLASNSDYFVSNGLTNALVSGVGICTPVFMIISAISNLFGIGAGSVMSRSSGKRNYERQTNAAGFAIYGCLLSLIIYSLFSLLLVNPIISFLANGDATIMGYAKTYIITTVVICGVPTGLNTLFSHLLRAEGRSFNASFGIAIGGILNVALDPLFMFVICDIKDAALAAALATGLSNIIAFIYYVILYIKIKNKTNIPIKFSKAYFMESIPGEVLRIGLPACLMTLCENISYMVLDFLVGGFASEEITRRAALAGVSAAKKVNMFAHSIARGMTQGVLPLIGYNKSSGKRQRMKNIVFASMSITLAIAVICLLINIFFAKPLSAIFLHDDSALEYSSLYLLIFSIGAPFSAIAYSVISFFQAVGKAWRSLILALLRKGILDIPLMFIIPLLYNNGKGTGIVMATPIADIACCLLAVILFTYYLKKHGKDKNLTTDNQI